MNPTPEQVAAWAREAGHPCPAPDIDFLQIFAARAMAEQAESDAKRIALFGVAVPGALSIAENIRANAPKVTT